MVTNVSVIPQRLWGLSNATTWAYRVSGISDHSGVGSEMGGQEGPELCYLLRLLGLVWETLASVFTPGEEAIVLSNLILHPTESDDAWEAGLEHRVSVQELLLRTTASCEPGSLALTRVSSRDNGS